MGLPRALGAESGSDDGVGRRGIVVTPHHHVVETPKMCSPIPTVLRGLTFRCVGASVGTSDIFTGARRASAATQQLSW
eukprot:gene8851-biopygen9455